MTLKTLTLFGALVALAACEAPNSDALVLDPAGAQRVQEQGVDAVAPAVSPQVAIQAFRDFCAPYPGNPAGTRRAAEAAGYVLFVSGTQQGLDMFASPDGRPMVGTGRQSGTETCMVLFKEGRSVSGVIESYVRAQHGGAAQNLGSIDTPDGRAENVWVAPGSPPILYFSLKQDQPVVGRVEAIAQTTE